ncbi:MAG: hypothetical protein ACKVKO_10295, partial [Acidimicrobiales bacterium]
MKNNRLVFTSISLLAAGLLLLTSCATASDEPAKDLALPSPTAEESVANEEGVSFEPKFAEVLDCPKSAIPKSQLSLVN